MIPWLKKKEVTETNVGIIDKFKQSLLRTKKNLGEGLASLLLGKKELDEALMLDVEMLLLAADIGVEATDIIIQAITADLKRNELRDGDAVFAAIKTKMCEILSTVSPVSAEILAKPHVILMVGINGVGKTTTIGKFARQYQLQGKKVMLAAGDTFRAAAVEQLQVWGERNDVAVVAQHSGSDSASVIFDALQSAQAKDIDVLIADTAGRMHTHHNLMEELKKIKRVLKKLDVAAPHEVLLVLDASIGQNALSQAKEFHEAVGVTGIILTKMDGSAKGGIVLTLVEQLKIPVKFIGVGENIEDLQVFDAEKFVDAIL
jgi:fused signal recognition particle receptor